MPRILVADSSKYSIVDLEKMYKSEPDKRVSERILAIIWSIEENINSLEIATRLRRKPQTIRKWIRDYNQFGVKGLIPTFKGGRKSKLDLDGEEFILGLLDETPEDYGYLSQVWDCILLAAVYSEKYQVELHKDVVWRMLKRRGYSFKRPEQTNPKADQELKKKKRNYSNPWKKRF